MESSLDLDGTREFAEESLNEEIKEELIDTVFDITGNEVNSSEVLQKLEELNDEEKALEQIDNIDDYEKEYIGEELKNKLFEDLIDSSIAPLSESGKIDKAELLQLNRTQFSSLGIFESKKVGNQKTKVTFIISVLKVVN